MLKTMYITNQPAVAQIAEKHHVDRIWVDLEIKNKEQRQSGRNSVISRHIPEDVSRIKSVLTTSELLVRINPLNDDSAAEIDDVIARGADVIMLPMYETAAEAERFLELVGGRVKTMLLLETIGAERCLDETLRLHPDEIHIGMNDLSIQYKMPFMFELLANGKIEEICNRIRPTGIPFGFGGIARLDEGALPAKYILGEHYRLGSGRVILSRSFTSYSLLTDADQAEQEFGDGLEMIRQYESFLETATPEFFVENHDKMARIVNKIVQSLKV